MSSRWIAAGWIVAAGVGGGCTSSVWLEEAEEGTGAGGAPSGASRLAPVATPSGPAGPSEAPFDAPADEARWQSASDTPIGCAEHTATAMGNGRVLIVGACWRADTGEALAALHYDLATHAFTPVVLDEPRQLHAAARGEDGRIVVAGDGARVEIFTPVTGQFHTGPLLLDHRSEPGLVVLPDGRVWVIGGFDDAGASLASTELVDLDAGESSAGPPLMTPRGRPSALTLPDGTTLVVGGYDFDPYESADPPTIIERSPCAACPFQPAGSFDARGNEHVAVSAPAGVALIAGFESAWWTGGATTRPIDHETTAYFPRAAVTATGRVFAAGFAGYQPITRILEISPGEPGRLLGSTPSGAVVTVTALVGDTVLVVGPEARLFTPD
jgi:hypothetical protein